MLVRNHSDDMPFVSGYMAMSSLRVSVFVSLSVNMFFWLFGVVFDDWVGKVRLFFSCYFAGYFYNISLIVLMCYVGLVEPYCADFLCTSVE